MPLPNSGSSFGARTVSTKSSPTPPRWPSDTAPKRPSSIGVSGGALTHDDRLDAVAGAVAHFQRAMMMDVDQAAKAMRDEEMNAEIEDFLEGFNQPTYRGMRINGQWVVTWSSRDGWSGDGRPDAEWLH
jgi:hypothetical protein